MIARKFYAVPPEDLDKYEEDSTIANVKRKEAPEADANLVSSLCDNGYHMPIIDLDFPHEYVPSSTPGHGHLYLNRPIDWKQLSNLLDALLEAHVIEAGFHRLSKLRGGTFVRKPGVMKETP